MSDWAGIQAGRVVLADEAILVLNKPAGISVMGERHDTDLVRVAAGSGERLFPVHRIDKVTSGCILFARQLRWHGDLTRQFSRGTTGKAYLAITRSAGLPARGTIDLPLSVGRKNRVRIAAPREAILARFAAERPARADVDDAVTAGEAAGSWTADPSRVFTHVRTYPSLTTFERLWNDAQHTLLLVRPATGRRHQIRVHLAWIGHPVEGDPLFGRGGAARTHLHSWRLAFDAAWRDGERVQAEAPPGDEFWAPIASGVAGHERSALLGKARRLAGEAPPRSPAA